VNGQTRVLPLKRDSDVFGSPPILDRRRTFSSLEWIFKVAALSSFLNLILSIVEVISYNCLFCPWIYQFLLYTFLNLTNPFTYLRNPLLHLTAGMRDFFYVVVKVLFLCCRNFKDKGWRRHCCWKETMFLVTLFCWFLLFPLHKTLASCTLSKYTPAWVKSRCVT